MIKFLNLFSHPAHWGILFVLLILVIATITIFLMKRSKPNKNFQELEQRVKSWWVMVVIFSTALLVSDIVSVVLFGLMSFLAFKEYVSVVTVRRFDRFVLFLAYLTIPVQYLFVGQDYYGMFIVFIPVWVFFLLPFFVLLSGEAQGYVKSVSIISWGLMVTVFSVSHVAMLKSFPATETHPADGISLILFFVILNQGNDVAQYVWGKMLGKHKILPKISPNKTWEGFLGGVFTTTLIGLGLHAILTPFSVVFAISIGMVIAVTGFIGDVTFSALKRDMNIKDASSFIPGHGGILDRIDSLSISGPLFFHLVYYFYY